MTAIVDYRAGNLTSVRLAFEAIGAAAQVTADPAAIRAALWPEESFMKAGREYLYFCTREPGSGQLYFSRTYEEHQQAVRLYRPLWEAYDQQHSQN